MAPREIISKAGEPAVLGAAPELPAPKKKERSRSQRADEK